MSMDFTIYIVLSVYFIIAFLGNNGITLFINLHMFWFCAAIVIKWGLNHGLSYISQILSLAILNVDGQRLLADLYHQGYSRIQYC